MVEKTTQDPSSQGVDRGETTFPAKPTSKKGEKRQASTITKLTRDMGSALAGERAAARHGPITPEFLMVCPRNEMEHKRDGAVCGSSFFLSH